MSEPFVDSAQACEHSFPTPVPVSLCPCYNDYLGVSPTQVKDMCGVLVRLSHGMVFACELLWDGSSLGSFSPLGARFSGHTYIRQSRNKYEIHILTTLKPKCLDTCIKH